MIIINDDEIKKCLIAKENAPEFDSLSILKRNSNNCMPLLYQYRNFDSFWKIIQADSFWVTNARFSNDEQEQRFGEKIINQILNKSYNEPLQELNENYIICFCENGDKLSQWRGYAPSGGVSIGFDFEAPSLFHVLKRGKTFDMKLINNEFEEQYVQTGSVCYLPSRNETESKTKCNDYLKQCRDKLASVDNDNELAKLLPQKSPFIKHIGFQEEAEWRLVFRNTEHKLDQCIQYRLLEESQVNLPYIAVRPGSPQYDKHHCIVRISQTSRKDEAFRQQIELLHKKLNCISAGARISFCCEDNENAADGLYDNTCFGCTKRRWYDGFDIKKTCRYSSNEEQNYKFALHYDNCDINISQGEKQEEIFDIVYHWVHNDMCKFYGEKMPKVWCEGHLPIREIIVGPCQNQRLMEENIKHYCAHTYWLRDVKIISSEIPFRKSI